MGFLRHWPLKNKKRGDYKSLPLQRFLFRRGTKLSLGGLLPSQLVKYCRNCNWYVFGTVPWENENSEYKPVEEKKIWKSFINKRQPTIAWSFTKIHAREKMGYG